MIRYGSILQTYWDWRAAGNFIFGGTGSGLMICAVLLAYPAPLIPGLGLLALGFMGLGLFLVWLEIGRPLRFLHVYYHPQTSWMTREGTVAAILFPVALLGMYLKLPWLAVIAGIFAAMFLYCQARIIKASKGVPAWREPGVVPLMVSTGLVEGAAIGMLALCLVARPSTGFMAAFAVLLLLRAYSWSQYGQGLHRHNAPREALAVIDGMAGLTLWGGNIAPLLLTVAAILLPSLALILVFIAAVAALISGWHMKYTIIRRASQLQGYAFGKLRKGRPNIKPPVRRKPDRFVF